MKTVGDYIDKIDDVKSIAEEVKDVYDWACDNSDDKNGSGNLYPYDPFILDKAVDFLNEYIDLLMDTVVDKK